MQHSTPDEPNLVAKMRCRHPRTLVAVASAGLALALAASITIAEADLPHQRVSQKDQAFSPTNLTIPRGTTLDVVNDDGDTLHHAFVDSPTFSFDSGDQEPGTTVAIKFDKSGNFNVLCGIHPRMKLKVHVQ